ncbi:hypothetical protein P7C73_g1830, partial [Tremellales sp. Uapishka_1]
MALFNRKAKAKVAEENDGQTQKEKVRWSKRPANTAFKQQRLKAWQPILTPKAVLPTLFLIGIIFAPIGALIVWGSGKVTTISLDYTQCDANAPTDGSFVFMPSSDYDYALSTSHKSSQSSIAAPTWSFTNDSSRAVGREAQCVIEFDVPYDLGPGVFLYYKLTNYYQNHRRYVQSLDSEQLKGDTRSVDDINSGDCKPITSADGKAYYPYTYAGVTLLNPPNGASNSTYSFSESGISWSGNAKSYVTAPPGSPSDYLPPPNWAKSYPNNYTDSFPDLASDEHFQVWMRVAALPTFRKLWGRNDNDVMTQGRYRIVANMNYPVKQFKGTKSIVISTVSWIGGKQPFLGWAYIAAAILAAYNRDRYKTHVCRVSSIEYVDGEKSDWPGDFGSTTTSSASSNPFILVHTAQSAVRYRGSNSPPEPVEYGFRLLEKDRSIRGHMDPEMDQVAFGETSTATKDTENTVQGVLSSWVSRAQAIADRAQTQQMSRAVLSSSDNDRYNTFATRVECLGRLERLTAGLFRILGLTALPSIISHQAQQIQVLQEKITELEDSTRPQGGNPPNMADRMDQIEQSYSRHSAKIRKLQTQVGAAEFDAERKERRMAENIKSQVQNLLEEQARTDHVVKSKQQSWSDEDQQMSTELSTLHSAAAFLAKVQRSNGDNTSGDSLTPATQEAAKYQTGQGLRTRDSISEKRRGRY